MKKMTIFLSLLFCGVAYATTETLNWYVDGQTYATTTCQTGGNIILPTAPTKYGYTFQGWNSYTPIEYIESTGTQWIDTGVKLGYDNTVSVKALTPSVNAAVQLFGNNVSPQTKGFTCNVGNNSRNISRFGNAEYMGNIFKDSIAVHTYTVNKNGIQIDNDTIIAHDVSPQYFIQDDSFFVLAARTRFGAENIMPSGTRIYSVIIYNNESKTNDFIPVLDADGTPCMYDRVSHEFLYNAGTDDFIAGPAVNE